MNKRSNCVSLACIVIPIPLLVVLVAYWKLNTKPLLGGQDSVGHVGLDDVLDADHGASVAIRWKGQVMISVKALHPLSPPRGPGCLSISLRP